MCSGHVNSLRVEDKQTYSNVCEKDQQDAHFISFVCFFCAILCGPASSVGIATDYGLDGPGSNPGGDEIFRPSRPALGPTQPPVNSVPYLSRG